MQKRQEEITEVCVFKKLERVDITLNYLVFCDLNILKQFLYESRKKYNPGLKGLISGSQRRGLIRRRVTLARAARVKHNVVPRIALFAIQISGRVD